MFHSKDKRKYGFTIVELLIVIVVIGILAAIVIVAYRGVQDRAQQAKVNSDMQTLDSATRQVRVVTGQPLRYATNSPSTGSSCWSQPSGTDLAALLRSHSCWTTYYAALDKISTISGTDVRGLIDPWGRPYYIDENEDEPVGACRDDNIGVYSRPFTTGQTMKKIIWTRGAC